MPSRALARIGSARAATLSADVPASASDVAPKQYPRRERPNGLALLGAQRMHPGALNVDRKAFAAAMERLLRNC